MHNTCIKHGQDIKTQYTWFDINLANEKGLKILSDSIECNHPSRNTSSLLYSESCLDGSWRSHIRKSIHVTSTSAKDLHEARMEKRIGFRTCSTIRSWATIWKFPIEPTKSKSQVVRERRDLLLRITRELCKMQDKTSRSQEIDVNSFHEETVSSERTERPVVETSVIQTRSSEDSEDPNVETT